MASTIRIGLLHFGNVQKTFNHTLLCRSLSTKVFSRVDVSSSNNSNSPNVNETSARPGPQKLNNCFPNERLKVKVEETFKSSQERILTLPNILTMSRIATAPAIGYFIWNGMNSYALACFAFAATTDLLDGFIARRFNQHSNVGAILDPLADKLLLTTSIISMYNVDMIPFWVVKGLVMRDVILLVVGTLIRYCSFYDHKQDKLKKFLDLKNYPTLGFEPTYTSKCCTALQCAVILVHLSTNHLVGVPAYDWSVFGLQVSAVGTAIISLAQYYNRAAVNHNFQLKSNRFKGPVQEK